MTPEEFAAINALVEARMERFKEDRMAACRRVARQLELKQPKET